MTAVAPTAGNEERSWTDDDRPMTLVYPTSEPDTAARYRERAEAWADVWDRRADVRVRADTQLSPDALRGARGLIAGSVSSLPVGTDRLAERGVTVREDGAFVVGGRVYDHPRDVLLLRLSGENGDGDRDDGRYAAVGRTDAAALDYAFANPFLFSGLPSDYRILRNGRLIAYGDDGASSPGRADGACRVPATAARHVDLRPGAAPTLETEHLRLFGHGALDPDSLRAFAEHRTSVLRALHAAPGAAPTTDTLTYHLFPTYADARHFRASVPPVGDDVRAWLRSVGWGRQVPSARAVRVDSTTGALVAVLDNGSGSISPTEARRWMRTGTGTSDAGAWEALLSVGRVARIRGSDRDRRAARRTARLHAAEAVPSLPALALDTTLVHGSPYAQRPVAATLVAFLEDRAETLLHGPPSREALRRLNPAWGRHLDSLVAAHPPSVAPSSLPDGLYGANVAFATGPAWGTPPGYGSPTGDAALSALRDLGATAAAIVPYTGMPAPDRPVALLPRRHPGDSQSDATVAHALRRAHTLGMDVMLKPQISGEVEWPGAIDMPTDAAWDRFFAHYADWMLHYALMAERYDVEVLSVGTELVEATRHHEAEWRRLIERVRAVYDGAVVYAANWGDEAERLSFGDALDAVGVDSYYPLSAAPNATDDDLLAGAETVGDRLQDVADRTGRPVLLTEVGFPNTAAAWVQPHRKREDNPESPTDQARATRALATALSDTSIRGAFWWRWSPICRFDYGRFPPKAPTREVLRDWFGRAAPPDLSPVVPPLQATRSIQRAFADSLRLGSEVEQRLRPFPFQHRHEPAPSRLARPPGCLAGPTQRKPDHRPPLLDRPVELVEILVLPGARLHDNFPSSGLAPPTLLSGVPRPLVHPRGGSAGFGRARPSPGRRGSSPQKRILVRILKDSIEEATVAHINSVGSIVNSALMEGAGRPGTDPGVDSHSVRLLFSNGSVHRSISFDAVDHLLDERRVRLRSL
jgi:hypothetical protein